MEVLLFPAAVLAIYLWFRFYGALFKVPRFQSNATHRALLAGLPLFCLAFIAGILSKWSSPDARSEPEWLVLYTMGGAAWLQLGLFLFSLFGVAARDDAIERKNPAAAWAVYGAMIGTTFCFAGSNVGSGPGPEAVFFCVVLSTSALFVFWFLFERIFRLADQITIERDESAGIRSGGWILSLGLIFGGAVTGNWVSVAATLRDFYHHGWVALLFLACGIAIESILRSLRAQGNSHRHASLVVALAYFLAAVVYVALRGIH